MLNVTHSRSLPYGIAVLTIALALLLKLLLYHLIEPESLLLVFFTAVMVSAYYGGWKSGILATGLATLSSIYFLLFSTDSFWEPSLIPHLQLTLFVIQGGLISALMGVLHRAKQTAEVRASTLRENEELLRQLTENIREVFWVFSPENNQVLYVSSAYEEIWGQTCAQLYEYPLSFLKAIHPEDRDRVIAAREKEILGEYNQEYRIVRPDGSVRWVRSRAFPIRNSLGQVYRIAGISEDITDRQQTQTELKRANERFQLAATAANCIIYDWDIQQNTVERTQNFTQLLGYPPSEVEVTNSWWRERIHPDDRERAQEDMFQALANPEVSSFEIEYRVCNKQGSYLYICDRGIITRNELGQAIRAVGCSLDLSDRKQVEEELYRREQEFKALAENSPDIISRLDKEFRHIYVSPAIEAATGLSPQTFIGKTHSELGIPEEQSSQWQRLLHTVFDTKQEQITEFNFSTPDGSLRYYQSWIVPEFAQDGSVESVLGVARDITNLKQTEAALRASEAKFRRLVDSNMLGVMFWDVHGSILDANDAFLQIVGYAREDLQTGQLRWKDITPVDQLYMSEQLIAKIQQMGAATLQQEYISKDGRRVPVLLGGVMFEGSVEQGVSFVLDLTELKQTTEALLESEKRFRRLVESNIFGVAFGDFSGGVYYANDYFLKMVGYERDDLMQGRVRWDQMTPPEYRQLDVRSLEELKIHGVAAPFEKEFIRKDGTRVPILLGTTLLQEPYDQQKENIAFILDLTERKQWEEERQGLLDQLENSLTQLEAVVNSMTEGLVIADLEGNVLTMNSAALRIHEYQSVEEVCQHLSEFSTTFELYYPDGQVVPVGEWPLARALRGETFHDYEVQVRRLDTGTVWIGNFGGTPVRDKHGQLILAINTLHDVTEKKRSQAELSHSLQREQAARNTAEAANRIKDEFLAVLSHELRSPLNPILGWSKLLRTGKLDEATTDRALETIERNAKLQTQLIEDLLDVSRILRGKLTLKVSPVSLASTIEAALETVRLAAQAKGIQIQTVFEPNMGLVSGDPSRLQQVIWNLLSNAVKFTPHGGRVDIGLSVVREQCLPIPHPPLAANNGGLNNGQRTTDNYAQLRVTDTGKGINPEFLPYVFDYFRQESSATTRAFGGLGLGLAIVRHLVELHGGTVWAESPGEGQGATFTVRLPLMATSSQMNQDDPTVEHLPDLRELQILIVDDEADMREFIVFTLEKYGAQVTAVASGAEALRVLATSKPDLLVCDIGMPHMDGYMLMRHIRAMPLDQGGQIGAIALTAYATEADHQQALSAGFQMHIAKPVEPRVLAKAIAKLVERPESSSPESA